MTNEITETAELEAVEGGWIIGLLIVAWELWEAAGHTHEVDEGLRDGYAAGQATWQ